MPSRIVHGYRVGVIAPHKDLSMDIITLLVAGGFYRDAGAHGRLVYLDWGSSGCRRTVGKQRL
jgi:hypothetical protein